MFSEQRAVRQSRQSVVKSSMTKVLAAFFKLLTGGLQLFNVTIEFGNVPLRLFSSQSFCFSSCVFGLSTFAFGLLSLCCCCADVFEILVVGKVDNRNDRQGRKNGIKTHAALELNNTAGDKCTNKVRKRGPKIVLGPGRPHRPS